MDTVRHSMRILRTVTACCGVLIFLGAYTIVFAVELTPNPRVADITNSNVAFGR